jgi:Fe-S-cluster-containing dehydrogenase component
MTVSRRGFLKGLGAGAAGTLAGATAVQAGGGAKHFAGHPGRYGLLHDTTLCVGCRSCENACTEVNRDYVKKPPAAVPPGRKPRVGETRRVEPNHLTVVNAYEAGGEVVFRKHQCMHCNEPCCASVCIVAAFEKTREGPVYYNEELCMGCRYCVTACPYYALSYEYDDALTPRVMRCTMCLPRIREGKNPGCADACPTGAITFGEREKLIEVARGRIRKSPQKYLDHIFGEHEFGGSSWMTLAGNSFGALGLHEGVTRTPLPEIGTSFLSVVPLIITIYPGLLAGFYAFSKRKEKLSDEEAKARVVEALMKADEETKAKLANAAARAKKDKEKAIAAAVKKALAEVAKAKEEAK